MAIKIRFLNSRGRRTVTHAVTLQNLNTRSRSRILCKDLVKNNVYTDMNFLDIKMYRIYRSKHVGHVLRTLSIYKYTINERGVKFRRLYGGSFLLKF